MSDKLLYTLEEIDREWRETPMWKKLAWRFWWWLKRLPGDIWWGIKWRIVPKHKYNRLDTGLPPGYYDPCYSIPRAVFVTTERFVEETRETVAWEWDKDHLEAWKAFTGAVEWFRKNKDLLDDGGYIEKLDGESWDDCWKRELDWQEEKNQHLMNIMKYIDFMWYP